MNKLIALCGLVLLGTTTTSQEGNEVLECDVQEAKMITTTNVSATPMIQEDGSESVNTVRLVSFVVKETPAELDLDEVLYIEDESVIDLGFDTADYLPEGFDPYEQYVDLNAVELIGENDSEALGFNTAPYLPENFNAYAYPADFRNIDYIEEGEDEINLGFDTAEYLPEGFDPHEFYVNLDAIEYIEDETLELDFNTQDYLPIGFNPYTK